MKELMMQVPGGIRELMSGGKFLALFLAVLLYVWYLWMQGRPGSGARRFGLGESDIRSGEPDAGQGAWSDVRSQGPGGQLLRYATLMLLLAVFPLTGLLLRLYQTRFYDYVWVTAYLPMTAVIAYGAAGLYPELVAKYCGKSFWKAAGLAALGLAVLLLCGNLPGSGASEGQVGQAAGGWDQLREGRNGLPEAENRETAARILDYLAQNGNTEDICLWAPADVLEYMRGMDGEIRLLYGRNMWEEALNAYSYDTYPEEVKEAYRWMEDWYLVLWGRNWDVPAEEALEAAVGTALEKGVNCILLPDGDREGLDVPEDWFDEDFLLGSSFAPGLLEEVERTLERSGRSVTKELVSGYAVYWIGA